MAKYIKIDKNNEYKCNKQVKEYLNPDYIYIPYNTKDILYIKDNMRVYKNDLILESNNKKIYSPVSGKVIGMCDSIVDNKKCKTIAIENDFEEKTRKINGIKKNIAEYSKEDLLEKIKSLGAFYGSLKGNTMVISGIDIEPDEEAYSYLLSLHTDQILECIDALISVLCIHKCFLAVKSNDSKNVDDLLNLIGTYPNIELKLINDYYPVGNKDVLVKELVWDSKLSDGVVFLTVQDVYNIYNVLKKNRPISEKYITISGNLLNEANVVNVKLGTRLADIISNSFKLKSNNYHVVVNGLLSGYETSSMNMIITSNVRSVFINTSDVVKENSCINCGMCHVKCPVKADPRTGYNMDKCIKCGLCNYICPSKIKLVGDKNE